MSATNNPEEKIMQEVVERYLECWNETDPAARRKLIGQVWAPEASYTDPLAEVTGQLLEPAPAPAPAPVSSAMSSSAWRTRFW
jgi:hypothetical protein